VAVSGRSIPEAEDGLALPQLRLRVVPHTRGPLKHAAPPNASE
jgi:hypothetical protein